MALFIWYLFQAIYMPDSASLDSSFVCSLPDVEIVYQLSIKQPQFEPNRAPHSHLYMYVYKHTIFNRQAPSITGRNGRPGPRGFTLLTKKCFISVFIFLALIVRFDLTPFQGALVICRQHLSMPHVCNCWGLLNYLDF